MERIRAATRGLTMQPLRLATMAAALRLGNLEFHSLIKSARRQSIAVARHRDVFQ